MTIPPNTPEAAVPPEHATADAPVRLLDALADRLARAASVRAVFGEPVRGEGVILIPVAKVRLGFGGGSGKETGAETRRGGGGGGGGADARPLGFIEVSNGRAVYRPARDPWTDVILPLACLIVGVVLARTIAGRRRRRPVSRQRKHEAARAR